MPIYKFNGDVYDIPQEKQAEFESQFPDASISYTAGADQYDIPVSKREDFLKDFPDAQLYTLETQPASNTHVEDNVEMEDFPMFDDEPNAPLGEPEAERGFGAGARESWKGMKAGFQNLWGETANLFTGSSQDSINALNELNDMVRQGKDVAAETENAWTDAGRELRTGAMELLPGWMIKGWKDRVADKAEKQKVLSDIREALGEAGGDVDKARAILEQRAQEMSYGDEQIAEAAEKFADVKPTEGFGAWVGSNVVQMIPSASALIVGAVTKSPAAARAIGTIGMAGMTASTAGSSMYEAREAGASDTKTWKVGVTDGMIEYLTEKLPFDRYTSRIMGKVKGEVAQDLFSALRTNKATRTELENLLVKANERLGGKLFSAKNLKEYMADMLAEGASEFSAEALQTMTSMMYEEPENYPTINEILTNGWEGAKAGFFMGAVLGGASKTMEHTQNRKRRMDKGSVDIALVDMGEGEKDVVEVVEYDAQNNKAVILRDGSFEVVSGDAISDGYRFSYDEFESARLREMEDEAIVSGNVTDGQIQGLEDNIARDIEEIKALAPEMNESEMSAVLQGEMAVEPGTSLGDAVAKYQEDVARHDELVAAKRDADAAKKEAIRTEIETAVGQRFWVQESGEDDGSGIVPVSETVEEVVYADGRVGYVVGSDESGNLTMVYTDGTKGFSSRAEITEKENSGEILSNTVMGLDDYLAVKMDIEEVTREKARMQEEHALRVEDMIANHPQGSVINVGTEEAKVEVPIIAPPTKDGVIVQMPDGTTPLLTWEDVAHAEKTEITPRTNAQLNQSIVDEYRVAYTPATPAPSQPTPQKEEQVKRTSPANPLPRKADGSVDQTALWNKDPEGWAQWNDAQRQDGGMNSLAYVQNAILREQEKIAELQTSYNAESDFDARDIIEKEIATSQARVDKLSAIRDGYLANASLVESVVEEPAPMTEEEANAAEEQRRQPLRERAQELSKKLGVKVNIAEDISDVKEAVAREEILRAEVSGGKQTVAGWFNPTTGEVTIYLPHAKDTTDVEQTFVHEVVAHKGIRGLLGEEGFNVLCDAVWDMMTEAERAKYMAYPGVNGDKRAAADEYIAHYAETMNLEESKPVWDRIMDIIMRILNSMGVNLEMTKDQLSDIIVASYQKLVKEAEVNAESEVAPEEAQATPIVSEEQLNAPNSGEAQQITAADGEVLADTDGKGGVRFSIRTWNEGGRDYLAAWLANDTTLTEEEKADILARMDEFYKNALLYSDTYAPFGTWSDAGVRYDNNGNPLMSVIKANGDYAMNLDFSLVCKKRRPLNRLLRTLVNRNAFATYTLRERELAEINWILQEHGFEVACALCFVDSKRYRVTGVADVFAALYNRLVKSLAPEGVQIAHFNYNNNPNVEVVENGLDTISDDQLNWDRFDRMLSAYKPGSVEHKVAQYLREHPEARKLVDATDFIEAEGFESVKENNPDLLKFYNMKKGTGGPKASFGDVQYLNDILKKEKSFDAEKAYAVGGVRLQSFSDFVPHMYFDYMQLFAELAAKKLPLHAYTKEVLFAKIFGLTGAKINMSLVPAVVEGGIAPGLDAEGNYAWADPVTDAEGNVIQQGQSFPYDEAMAIQQAEGYSKNCGVIAVGISDAHIEKMLDDPNIPFIIPYHKSSLNAIVARMTNIDQYKDYTNVQNTRKASGSKLDKGTKDFNFNEYLHGLGESGTPQQAAQAYLDWCRENNYKPKFSQFAYHPNYYKLLQDFNTIDLTTGEYAPQGAVTMTFPTEESAFGNVETLIQQGLQEDAELEEKMEQEIDGIADQVLARLEEISKEPKVSKKQQAKKMAELADERMAKIKAKAQGPIDLIEEARKAVAREDAKKNKKAKKSEVRFRITPEQDKAYMDAVEAGDMETAQRMVDEAARLAGYDSPKLYHGTRNFGFTKADVTKSDDGISFFTTTSPSIAKTYSSVGGERRISDKASTEDRKAIANELGEAADEYLLEHTSNLAEWLNVKDVDAFALELTDMVYGTVQLAEEQNKDEVTLMSDLMKGYDAIIDKYYDADKYASSEEQINNDDGTWDNRMEVIAAYGKYIQAYNNPRIYGNYTFYATTWAMEEIDCKGANWNNIKSSDLPQSSRPWTTRRVARFMKEEGWKGVILKNIVDLGGRANIPEVEWKSNSYIFFEPQWQVKSADPVTYDDNGNVIPLSERFNPENEDIRFRFTPRTEEQREKLFADAKEKFGVTNNFKVAGYMLPDGSLLDFSEANDGGDPNVRSLDHRSIEDVIMEDGTEYESRWMYIADFMNEGAIRLLPESAGINMIKAPTEEQRKKIFDFIYKYNGEVILEINDERLNSIVYMEYDRRTSPSRIFRDIDGYFNDGIIPQQDVRFRTSNNNQAIFVSNAAKAVEGIKQEKATPEQWLKMIEKNGGLKAAEDKWMGLSDWLKVSDKKTLTKQEVLDFVNENMITIEEVHYDESAEDRASNAHSEIVEVLQNKYNDYVAEYHEEHGYDDEYDDPASKYAIEKLREEMEDSFPYTIELVFGNEVYVTFDYEEGDEMVKWAEKTGVDYMPGENPINETRLDYTTDGLTNKHEIALTVPTIESWNETDEVHFGDAGDGRAVAWIRFGETQIYDESAEESARRAVDEASERELAILDKRGKAESEEEYRSLYPALEEAIRAREEAVWAWNKAKKESVTKKILVIDEIQSKRHQEGREKGYATMSAAEFSAQMNDKYGTQYFGWQDKASPEEWEKYRSLSNAIPDAPFEKNWHELAMKRMLRYAAENGYDVVAWTKGDQQAERYNIGDVVTSVDYRLNNDGSYHVDTMGRDGYQMEGIPTTFNSEAELAEIFGKDIARKIAGNLESDKQAIAEADKEIDELREWFSKNTKTDEADLDSLFESAINNPEQSKRWNELEVKKEEARKGHTLSETDFRIGGEGMKGFYDKMLPAFMNKYGKKWGVKVEDIELPNLENGLTMHSVPVTEEMKASVMEGQVMFRARMPEESSKTFMRSAVDEFSNSYNTIPIAVVYPNSRKMVAEALGFETNDLPEEVFQRVKDEANRAGAFFANFKVEFPDGRVEERNRILIFVNDKYTRSTDVDRVLFHENIHAMVLDNPELLRLGNWLIANSNDGVRARIAGPIKEKYGEDRWDEEMLCDYVGVMLSVGRGQDVIDIVPNEHKPLLNYIYERFGYKPEDDDPRRRSERRSESGRLGMDGRTDSGIHMRDTGLPEGTAGSKDGSEESRPLTAEERRVINEYFPGAFKETEEVDATPSDENDIRYRVVTDQETLDRLNSEPTIKVYRAMQLIDGKLYPPMSAKVDGELRQPIELGQWEEAEERPDLVDDKGRFKLDKGNKTSLKARYNPYFHTSPTPLNDQFSSAQTRPELVTVEVEVPESELTSGYKAEKAKDSVGKLEWKAGVVQSKLSGTRTVILSRWDKPVRIVPDSEVADVIVDMFEGKDITMPSNVVTPSLRAELEKRGVPFVETDNQGNPVEEVSFRVTGTPTDELVTNGLRLTPAQTAEVAANIFAALPEESRKKLTEGLNGNILGLKDAILQIPTSLATKENWNEEDKQMADVVAEEMTKMAGEMTRPFSAEEGLWLLYNNLNKGNDLISQASRALVQRNLGFDKETLAEQEAAKDGVRYRIVGDARANTQARLYNKGAANVWTRLKESFVDMQASVEELVSAIEKATGEVAKGFENILLALNQQSSKGLAAMESYEQRFLMPMFDEVRKIMDKAYAGYDTVVRYVILKHGLERNKKLAQRDAKAHYQEIYDEMIAKVNSMDDRQKRTYLTNAQLQDADAKAKLATLKAADTSAFTEEEKNAHKRELAKAKEEAKKAKENLERAQKINSMSEQELKDELDKVFEKIENGTDSVYKELRKNDYSGISSMFYDQLGVNRKDYSTEEEYQAALMLAKNDRFSSLEDVEAQAEGEVSSFEGRVDTKELWKRINAATKETLRQQYEANMISKDQYESLRNMFEYYVPLRGFKDNTAEDMYTYYRKPNSTGYTKPILGAEGRKTEAESPFGWIAAMAGSAIASNVKNEAKLALYYFVSNRPENGIATISRTWFVHTPGDVDANGKKIYRPAYPPFSEDLSSDAAKQAYEDWQEQMRELKKQGLAYEAGQRLNLGNAVVNISDSNKPEHVVTVKVAGKDYTIVINGNPRAAQAINGELNLEGTADDYSAIFGPVLRWMSSVNTSYNPEFWITNLMRDMAFTWMAVNTKEDPAYRRRFSKNYRKAFKVISLVAKNEKGTIGNSYIEDMYKDFVKYGGVTGYTQIKDSETWEKEIDNYLSSTDPESLKNGKMMRGMKKFFHATHRFGESLEQVSRFAAFLTSREMGKSINEAIADAKEITVNFNRKGSGKMISLEESKYLTDKNGRPLSPPARWAAVGLSSIAPLGRRTIMFFNAAVQGLNSVYRLWKKNPKRLAGWTAAYFAIGVMNAALHALLDDDDDDYLDIPQYERRNSLMIGGNGAYLKWALPQEARAFYALGDLAVESIMGRNPHQNVVGEALKIATEVLPVNPTEGWKAFVPSVAIPAVELMLNEDYKGAPIYNEQKWLSEEEKKRTAKWSSAYQGTGLMYKGIAQGLNYITGGDKHEAGYINLQPEKMEHIVQSAFGGTIRTADKFINTITAMIDPEEPWTVRQTPFLNRILTLNDERFKNVHVNDVFNYYKADAEHASTLEKKYIKDRDMDALNELRSSDEYQWAKIYSKYKKPLKAIQEKLKVADGTAEKKELMRQQDEIKRRMIKEISEL